MIDVREQDLEFVHKCLTKAVPTVAVIQFIYNGVLYPMQKYEVSELLLQSVVQNFEEALYQGENNDWELDIDLSVIEEIREILSGPAMEDLEDGAEEKGAEDEVEACKAETADVSGDSLEAEKV